MDNPTRLRPVGQLLIDTWKTYRANFKKICYLMLWGIIGVIPYALAITIDIRWANQLAPFQAVIALLTFLFYLIFLYWLIATFLGLLLLLKNPEKKIIDLFNEGRKLVWGDLAVGVIVFLFVTLWSLLFVIPGIIFAVFYVMTTFAFVYDGYRRSAALARSKELVSGNWWSVLGRFLLGILTMMIVAALYSALLNVIHSVWLTAILQLIYYVLIFLLLTPLFSVYQATIYGDLVAMKPTSVLPKEKKDYWLVTLATIFVVAFVIALLMLLAFMVMSAIG